MKFQYFILGLFVVATVAQSEVEARVLRRRHIGGRHVTTLDDSNSENQNEVNDGSRRHHHFTHNADWHKRHGIPMPDEIIGGRLNNNGECNHNHHFTHNPEWHRRNVIPMPDGRHHGYYPYPSNPTTRTPISSTTTTSTTSKPLDWEILKSTTSSTVEPDYSREIYDNTRTHTEYDDTEMINMP